jgi:hypothetical protein
MIPRVRLTYVQGLGAVHEDLRRPREVDLTTDGESLIVAPPASGRPLAKLPLTAVEGVVVEPDAGPTTATNKVVAGLELKEDVLVLRFRAAPGVAAAVAEQPVVFADPRHGDVAAKVGPVQDVLTPRTAEDMARLEKGERRRAGYYAVGFVASVATVLVLVVMAIMAIFAPRPRQGLAPVGPTPVAPSLAVAAV